MGVYKKIGKDPLLGYGDPKDILLWPRAERYVIYEGRICPQGPRREEDEKTAGSSFNLDRRSPLDTFELLFSFANLFSKGRPNKKRVEAWVNEWGLLYRFDSNRGPDDDLDDINARKTGTSVNQAPVLVEKFNQEGFRVRDILRLHDDIRRQNVEGIRKKMENPDSESEVQQELARAFQRYRVRAPMELKRGDPFPWFPALSSVLRTAASGMAFVHNLGREFERLRNVGALMRSIAPDIVLLCADQVVSDLVAERSHNIRYRPVPGYSLPDELRQRTLEEVDFETGLEPPKTYRSRQSFTCLDLLSGIYLQLDLFRAGRTQLRRCEHETCEGLFPARANKKYCNEYCQDSAKKTRKYRGNKRTTALG